MQLLNATEYLFQSSIADKIADSIGDVVADTRFDVVVPKEVGLTGLWSLLGFNRSLLTHSSENDNVGVFLLAVEKSLDLLANLTLGNLDVIFGLAVIRHQGEEAIVGDIKQLVFLASNIGNIHVVGGWAKFFKLLAGEDINGNKMNFGVAMLAGLGGGHVNDLARAVLDNDESVLPQGRALHGVGSGSASIGRIEGVLMLGIVVLRHLI